MFNCKQIFNKYCSIILGTTIQPKKSLYQYTNRPREQKVLSKIRFPTPLGWRSLEETDYKKFWYGVDLEKIFSADRVKKKSASDKEETRFVYLVVLELRQQGFLSSYNKPNSSIQFETRRNCPLDSNWSRAIRLKNIVFQSNEK